MANLHFPLLKNLVRLINRTFLRTKNSWHGGSTGYLLLFCVLVAVLMVLPMIYAVMNALNADLSRWVKLFDVRVPRLLWKTLSLAGVVSSVSIFLGFSLSWFVVRSDLPGRKYWEWLQDLRTGTYFLELFFQFSALHLEQVVY